MTEKKATRARKPSVNTKAEELPTLHRMLKIEAERVRLAGADGFADGNGGVDVEKMQIYIAENKMVKDWLARVEGVWMPPKPVTLTRENISEDINNSQNPI